MWPIPEWTHREMILTGQTNQSFDQAYSDVGASLEAFKALSDAHGFEALLVIVASPAQVVYPENTLPTMQERITAMAERVGLRSLDLLPVMRDAYAKNSNLYIPWDRTHLTPHGHSVVAQALESYLVGEQLVDLTSRQ